MIHSLFIERQIKPSEASAEQKVRGSQPPALPQLGGVLPLCPGSGLPREVPEAQLEGGRKGVWGALAGEGEGAGGRRVSLGDKATAGCPTSLRRMAGQARPVKPKSDSWMGPQRPSSATSSFQSPDGKGLGHVPSRWSRLVPMLGVTCCGPGAGDAVGQGRLQAVPALWPLLPCRLSR